MERSEKQMEQLRSHIIGAEVTDLYYEESGDYYIIKFKKNDGTTFETAFRFMAEHIESSLEQMRTATIGAKGKQIFYDKHGDCYKLEVENHDGALWLLCFRFMADLI